VQLKRALLSPHSPLTQFFFVDNAQLKIIENFHNWLSERKGYRYRREWRGAARGSNQLEVCLLSGHCIIAWLFITMPPSHFFFFDSPLSSYPPLLPWHAYDEKCEQPKGTTRREEEKGGAANTPLSFCRSSFTHLLLSSLSFVSFSAHLVCWSNDKATRV
jgi:hypothetical protein